MHQALNMAKMAKGAFSRATIEETHDLIKKCHAKVRKEMKRGVEFPGHPKVKAAIERDPDIVHRNDTRGCLPCSLTPETICRHAGDTQEQVHHRPTEAESKLQS
jgi:hypothetical protein